MLSRGLDAVGANGQEPSPVVLGKVVVAGQVPLEWRSHQPDGSRADRLNPPTQGLTDA